ncbi:MAG: FAD-binding and (Fe-S)-binding domain-containing protein, partial [Anaerolineales bacterium]
MMTTLLAANGKVKEFTTTLRELVEGEVRTDITTRVLYSTDASIYQIEPLGVFFPRNLDEISQCVELASEYEIAILPRGSGTSLAGQAIGPGLIIDCSRHLDRIIKLDRESKTAVVEPGVILSTLNKTAGKFNLQFGPDPASAERATMGGVIGNNATGAHSIRYGMAADHVLSMDIVLSDGTISKFKAIGLDIIKDKVQRASVEGKIYQAALDIRNDYAKAIQEDWPQTWRRSSGYNLNYLLPWSPSMPPLWGGESPYPPIEENQLNIAQLIAGSEGTLGIFHQAEVNLVPKPKYTNLVLLAFPDVISACEEVEEILEYQPSAVEFIPENMLRLASTIPFYAQQINFLNQIVIDGKNVPNLLVIEFDSENPDHLTKLSTSLFDRYSSIAHAVNDPDLQERIWKVRKVGLGLLMSISGDIKPITFIEDLSVPISKLSQFVSELEKIMAEHNTSGDFYAHASAGCLHLRPLINLKTVNGVENMRAIAREAIELVVSLGGVPSGEHGDGIARSEWLNAAFGPRLGEANKRLKVAADPKGILNPGKITEPIPMDENLRYGENYSSSSWKTNLDFAKQDGLAGAIELCNGAGVCRKFDGLMCPSFQVTKEEEHSTRGRANLLRALISNMVPDRSIISDEEVYEALDLCLACKGCKAECPSGVDMAKLKYEFMEHYYSSNTSHRHPARDYLFGYIHTLSKIGSVFSPITNLLLEEINQVGFLKNQMGFSGKRKLPQLSRRTLRTLCKNKNLENSYPRAEKVLFLSDPFTEYYQPEIGMAAIDILTSAGCHVDIIPIIGSGRTLVSKGFVNSARKHAEQMVDAINLLDVDKDTFIVGVEPSEIYTLRDEYPDLFPGSETVKSIAERAFMIDEFMIRPGATDQPRVLRIDIPIRSQPVDNQEILLHGHCYQKSQPPAGDGYPIGVQATIELLKGFGFDVDIIDSGCCGMAGAFGYETEHYDISMEIGEISLFPQIRNKSEDCVIAASGFSCMTQIKEGTGVEA